MLTLSMYGWSSCERDGCEAAATNAIAHNGLSETEAEMLMCCRALSHPISPSRKSDLLCGAAVGAEGQVPAGQPHRQRQARCYPKEVWRHVRFPTPLRCCVIRGGKGGGRCDKGRARF